MNDADVRNDWLAEARVYVPERAEPSPLPEWRPHPTFAGVSLRQLIGGSDTAGRLTCLVVNVQPGCRLEMHAHERQLELHEVIDGAGELDMGGRRLAYRPGCMTVIPEGVPHAVLAGAGGLKLLAKFIPAV